VRRHVLRAGGTRRAHGTRSHGLFFCAFAAKTATTPGCNDPLAAGPATTKTSIFPRKTAPVVRLPATKFPKLQKRLKIGKIPVKMKFRKP
jgi:hypothetical protein